MASRIGSTPMSRQTPCLTCQQAQSPACPGRSDRQPQIEPTAPLDDPPPWMTLRPGRRRRIRRPGSGPPARPGAVRSYQSAMSAGSWTACCWRSCGPPTASQTSRSAPAPGRRPLVRSSAKQNTKDTSRPQLQLPHLHPPPTRRCSRPRAHRCRAGPAAARVRRRRRPHRERPPTPGPPGATGGRGLPPPRGAARRSAGRQGVVITRRPRPGERADDQHPAARPALPDPHQPHRGHPGREGRLPAAAPAHRSGRGCGAGG